VFNRSCDAVSVAGETKLENLHHLADLCLWSRMVLKLVKDKMWNELQCIRIVSSVGF